MTDKVELIRAEIERLKAEQLAIFSKGEDEDSCGDALTHIGAYNQLLSFIDSLPEEPVSEDLEDAAIQICQKVLKGETIVIDGYEYVVLSDAEECFKAGAQWQQEQMMSKAVDALVHTFDNGYIRVGTQLLANNKYSLKLGDKVKVIIIKDE